MSVDKYHQFLIQASYGFVGEYGGKSWNITRGGLSVWAVASNGSPHDLCNALRDLQNHSGYVHDAHLVMDNYEIPRTLCRWYMFSVVKEFAVEEF